MSTDRENAAVMQAASALEEISLLASVMTDELRNVRGRTMSMTNAYDRVYWLRHRMGKIVASLGAGPGANQDFLTHGYALYLVEDKD